MAHSSGISARHYDYAAMRSADIYCREMARFFDTAAVACAAVALVPA